MKDIEKTKGQMIGELAEMRQRIAEMESAEAEHQQAEAVLRESVETKKAILHIRLIQQR